MRGSRDGFDVVVLDYHDDHDDYTLVGLRSPSWTLPTFRLEPRVGTPDSGDIVVESHPDFSRTYSLVTGDEPATRAAFTPGVLDHLSTRKGLVVEGSGQRLVVWRLFENTEPAAIPALVEQALAIARLLRSP